MSTPSCLRANHNNAATHEVGNALEVGHVPHLSLVQLAVRPVWRVRDRVVPGSNDDVRADERLHVGLDNPAAVRIGKDAQRSHPVRGAVRRLLAAVWRYST